MTAGDAARTAADVAGSETLFRLGITGLLVVVAFDVVVALALYRVLRLVDGSAARLDALSGGVRRHDARSSGSPL